MPFALRSLGHRSNLVESIAFHEAVSDLPTGGRDQRERHRAADQQRVGALDECVQHTELVRHLRAAEDGHVRAVGIGEEPAEDVDLPLEQPPGDRRPARCAHEVGQGHDARVRAMRRSEGVVHVRVGELCELPREPDIVGLLSGMEPEVLQQDHVPRLDVTADGLGPVADDLVERHHVDAEQLTQPVGDGPEAQIVLWLPLRPPEVGRDDERGAPVEELAERREGRADPHVVGDPAALERHVEVGADEDPAAGDVAELVEGAERH